MLDEQKCTFNAGVSCFQVRHEVSLARMSIDKVADWHVTGGSPGALAVHVGDHVRRTTDVVVADDAATESHATVRRRCHEDDRTRTTAGVERLVKTEVST